MAPRRFVPRWLPSAWHTPFQSNPFRALSPFITSPLRREEGGEDRVPRSPGGGRAGPAPPFPPPGTKGATEQHRDEFALPAKAFAFVVVVAGGEKKEKRKEKREKKKKKKKAIPLGIELFSLMRGRERGQGPGGWLCRRWQGEGWQTAAGKLPGLLRGRGKGRGGFAGGFAGICPRPGFPPSPGGESRDPAGQSRWAGERGRGAPAPPPGSGPSEGQRGALRLPFSYFFLPSPSGEGGCACVR